MMKRFLSLKSLSRTVHINDHEEHGQDQDDNHDHQRKHIEEYHPNDVVRRASNRTTSLTVWRKSLLMSCNGFTVIDSHGNLIYRVDNYIGRRPVEIILMDGSGNSVLTMRRHKKLGLVDNWYVYEGEFGDHRLQYCKMNTKRPISSRSKRPIFCVRKNINLLINAKSNALAYIYRDTWSEKRPSSSCDYVIEGSYTHRSCKVLEYGCSANKVVAETRRKEEIVGGVSYGLEVFHLIVHPGFDPAFAMALVLLLDQMFS